MDDQPITNPGAPWFKADGPLPDGYYWWRAGEEGEVPQIVEIDGGYAYTFSDQSPNEPPYRGEWCGPISPPVE